MQGYDLVTFSNVYVEEWDGEEILVETEEHIVTTPPVDSEIGLEECTEIANSDAVANVPEANDISNESKTKIVLCRTPTNLTEPSCERQIRVLQVKPKFESQQESKTPATVEEVHFPSRNTTLFVGDTSSLQSIEGTKGQTFSHQILAPAEGISCSRLTEIIPRVHNENYSPRYPEAEVKFLPRFTKFPIEESGFSRAVEGGKTHLAQCQGPVEEPRCSQAAEVIHIKTENHKNSETNASSAPVTQPGCSRSSGVVHIKTNIQNNPYKISSGARSVQYKIASPIQEPNCSNQPEKKVRSRPDLQHDSTPTTSGNACHVQIAPPDLPAPAEGPNHLSVTEIVNINTVSIGGKTQSVPSNTLASVGESSNYGNDVQIVSSITPAHVGGPSCSKALDQVGQKILIKAVQRFSVQILVELLNRTITGKEILKRGARGPLSNESQRELVGIIADYHNSLGIAVKEEVLRDYSEAIITQFKHETLVCIEFPTQLLFILKIKNLSRTRTL